MYEDKLIPILKGLNNVSDHIVSSSLLTSEGMVLAAVAKDGVNEDRNGSYNAAMLSLSHKANDAMDHGELNQILIKGENGFVLMTNAGDEMALSVRLDSQANIERICPDIKHVAENISKLF